MRFKAVFLSMAVSILLIFVGADRVSAEEIKIAKDNIKAELKNDGSISVIEEISFNFSGKYNGVYKDIAFDKGGPVSNLTIGEPYKDSHDYKLVESADNGDKGVYTLTESNNNLRVKIFSPSKDEVKTFRIQYSISEVAKRYSDIGEFYWKFIGKNNETPIDELIISVMLPQGSRREDIKAYGHGPKNGQWKISDDRTVIFTAKNLTAEQYVEVRTLFPRNLLSAVKDSINENVLPNILNEEKTYFDREAAENRQYEALLSILRYAAVIISAFNVLIIVYIFTKVRKPKDYYHKAYGRDIRDYDPTLLAYNASKFINNNHLVAAILELARKGYINVDAIDEWVEEKNYKKYKFQNYEINMLKERDDSLHGHERYLMHWLFKLIGDGGRVTLEQIKRYSEIHANDFRRQFGLWQGELKLESDKMALVDKKTSVIKGSLIGMEILLLIADAVFIALVGEYGAMALFITIIALFSAITINARTPEGNIQYELWEKMKKDIKSAGESKIKNWIQDEEDFKFHMIYGLAMGLKDYMSLKMKPYLSSCNYNTGLNNFILISIIMSDSKNGFYTAFDSSFSGAGYSSSGGFSSGGGGGFSGGGGGAGGF